MKHIALRYFLARELQQRGQLRLAYVATRANTAGGGGGGGVGRGGAAQRGGFGGSQCQQHLHSRETPSAQQLREWYAGRGRSWGVGPCTYVLRTGGCRGETCGLPHTAQRCFGRLTDAWRAQFPDAVELPRCGGRLRQNVAIFYLDFDAILAAIYAVIDSAEGDCYLCVPPDPGIEAATLGAGESAAPGTSASAAPGTSESTAPGAGESARSGTTPTEALHTFTLDSGASRSFFNDSTTLTPLSQPVAVSLADSSGGPVLAHSSTVLPCPAAPSGLLSGLHLPSFSTNLVSGAELQDLWVAASSQVLAAASRSSPASAPCSCRPLSYETLLWHHRLGHPSLPRLRGIAFRILVSCLPRSLPPLPPGPAPTCVPCVEGRQRAAPHSSEFPPTEAPLQTLHMDVWGPARLSGQGQERYFLLVVDDYSRYTTVFPLRHKDRGGEFSSDLLRAFCRAEGIRQTFTLPASPQQHGIAERRIGMVMDVARTSMIHAAAPHFLWPFAVQYVAHQINLLPRVSLPETTPTLRWTGKVGDASAFRVWGSRAFLRDTSADKLSSRAVPYVFLGFPPNAPGWQLYHPTSRRVLSSYDVTFDKSVSYYRVSQLDPVEPVEVAVDSGAARGAEPAGAGPGGAEPGVAESEGAEPGGAESGGAEPWGAEPGGAEPERAESGGPPGVPSRREPLSPQRLREWYARRCRRAAGGAYGARAAGGAAGAGAARAAGPGGAGVGGTGAVGGPAGVGDAGVAGAAGPGGARTGGTGATGAGAAGGTGAGGAVGVVAGDPGAEGTGAISAVSRGTVRPRPPLRSAPSAGSWSPAAVSSCSASASYSCPRQTLYGSASFHCSTAVPLPSPPASSLPNCPDPESDSLRSTSPTVTHFLATTVTDPSFESTATSALVAEIVDFATACRLDYAASLVAVSGSASVCPPSIRGECALGTDVLEDR
ncbi:unnamed protein product [Closterium sp. NIES-53]